MHVETPAIVCALLSHGEHGVIARLMTPEHGLLHGYVRGGRSRRLRPVLQPGNLVQAEFRARTDEQLAQLTVELTASRAPLIQERLPAAAIDWVTALTAVALPESQPYPALYSGLDALLRAIEAAPAARGWVTTLVRYELLLLAQLGFGIYLDSCAATGTRDDLAYVSPRSSRAVSRAAGQPYAERLLPLPAFLLDGSPTAQWPDILGGLALTGHFIERDIITDRRLPVLEARHRLVERIRRISQ
jgi:DNA repair protein RecO (recombination protein O)